MDPNIEWNERNDQKEQPYEMNDDERHEKTVTALFRKAPVTQPAGDLDNLEVGIPRRREDEGNDTITTRGGTEEKEITKSRRATTGCGAIPTESMGDREWSDCRTDDACAKRVTSQYYRCLLTHIRKITSRRM